MYMYIFILIYIYIYIYCLLPIAPQALQILNSKSALTGTLEWTRQTIRSNLPTSLVFTMYNNSDKQDSKKYTKCPFRTNFDFVFVTLYLSFCVNWIGFGTVMASKIHL